MDQRGPLRSGRAIKVFAHERVEAEEADERRACKKEKSKGRGKSLSGRSFARLHSTRRSADVPRSMIDRYDWGPSNLQLVARHVRIITQHASVVPPSPSRLSPRTLFSAYPLKDVHSRLRRLGSLAPLSPASWSSYYEPIRNAVQQRDDKEKSERERLKDPRARHTLFGP